MRRTWLVYFGRRDLSSSYFRELFNLSKRLGDVIQPLPNFIIRICSPGANSEKNLPAHVPLVPQAQAISAFTSSASGADVSEVFTVYDRFSFPFSCGFLSYSFENIHVRPLW